MIVTAKHHQRGIKVTPTLMGKLLHQLAEAYAAIHHRTMGDDVVEQTDVVVVGGIDGSQVVALLVGSIKRFGFYPQLIGLEELLQVGEPFGEVKLVLKEGSQSIGGKEGIHDMLLLKGF